jgi:flagellar hook assembly protein FlgD
MSASPNPSRDGFTIRFTTSAREPVAISIFDAAGRRVRTIRCGPTSGGSHEARWDGRDESGAECGPGIYFARLPEAEAARTVRLLRVR